MSEHDKHEDIAAIIRGADVRAPAELHARVAQMVADATSARRPLRARLVLPGAPARAPFRALRVSAALAAAAVIAIVAVAATGGVGGAAGQSPVVSAAARLTLASSTAPAPPERVGARLAAQVEGVAFPYWQDALGWRAAGARTANLAGRLTKTVYYVDARGRRVGYSIISGVPAPNAAGGRLVWRHGTPYRLLSIDGVQAVVWPRNGRLCVVSGRGVSSAMLVHLASWERPAAASPAAVSVS